MTVPEASKAVDPRVLKDLRHVVGADHVMVDRDLTASYGSDWTGRFTGTPSAVIRPGTVAEVAEVIARCRGASIALVPQGGNTGLVGGGVPLAGEAVLSLRRLSGIADIGFPRRAADRRRRSLGRTKCRRPRRRQGGPTGSTWGAGTAPRSAAPSPPMPADCRCSGTAPPGPS